MMTTGSILLAVALFLFVAMWVFRPLLTQSPRAIKADERDQLLVEKTRLVNEIKALAFDLETGKLSDVAYQQERDQLVAEAADTLRQIDALPNSDHEIEAAIEQIKLAREDS